MRMCRKNFLKYVFTLLIMCVMVSLYIAALKHNRDIHKSSRVIRLRVKRNLYSNIQHSKHRAGNMTHVREPPHPDKYNNSFKGRGNDTVNVYIVEQHHEVIPYWFSAAQKEMIPKSGNTLVHIDGNADLASPLYVPGYPVFISPHERELKFLMQANDAFIQASAIAGLVNRVIWVWPDWDERNHESSYSMSTISLGFVPLTHHVKPTEKGFCACMKNGINFECKTLTNVSRLANRSSNSDDFIIPRSLCKIKKILIVEEIHEDKALAFFGKRDWIAKSENIILDIDEDYYGYVYAIEPLLEAKLSHRKLSRLDNLIASYICPITANQEKESDTFLMELLSVTRTKHACNTDKDQKHSESCDKVTKIDLYKHFVHQLNRSVTDNKMRMCFRKKAHGFVHNLVPKLLTFTFKQMRAVQKTGFCLRTTPNSLKMDGFGLCIGTNTPKEKEVVEHIPTSSEVTTKSLLLKEVLKKITYHSVGLVTISRSVRDGYTPRQFFEQIEADILNGLNVSFNNQINVHYNHGLLGGKSGWPARHKA